MTVILISLFLGIVNAFDIPVRQSFVVQKVDFRDDLSNAIALNSSMVNGAKLIGPTIAGLLVASVGEGVCFAINSASYLAVIAAIVAMRVARWCLAFKAKTFCTNFMRGFVYR